MARSKPRIDRGRLLANLSALAQIGKVGPGVKRLAYSKEDLAAREWLCRRMAEAGLEPLLDNVGNAFGRFPKAKRALLLGSHTDTVPTGGRFDGSLGVIYALEIARSLLQTGEDHRVGVDVVSFADEEGTFAGWLGSRTFCGDVGEAEHGRLRNQAGVSLRDALQPLADKPAHRLSLSRNLAYLEAHIEQGPRLEALGKPIGIVTSIVGIRDKRITFTGQADHAGTTPMGMRSDAGQRLIRFAGGLLDRFEAVRGPETVWNLGNIILRPGAQNVVPEFAELLVQYRDSNSGRLSEMDSIVQRMIAEQNRNAPGSASLTTTFAVEPMAMAESIQDAIRYAAEHHRVGFELLASGAGHDAAALARHLPAGMLFVPSKGGRSHTFEEDMREEDIVAGAEIMLTAVERLVRLFEGQSDWNEEAAST